MESEKEYIKYLEGMAQGIQLCISWNNDKSFAYHRKSYDPLTIEKIKGGFEAHSYVFNFHNGGRHHKFVTLGAIYDALLKEIEDRFTSNKGN